MKFKVTFKDPDGPHDCIRDEAKRIVGEMVGLAADEQEALTEMKHEKLSEFAGKWLSYGEYVTIEFDTEANTATVVETK